MKNNNIKKTAIAVVLVGMALPAAVAQQATSGDMATVYVAASRSQTRIEQMPLHTTIISQDQIRMSSAQTVDQLLRDVPGMNFSAVPAALSDPTGHQTKMRGLGNAKVLMLLDGVPMHDPFYLTTQWFKVPLSNIERVEILRGGNSSLWGNMAVAGVVNIVTRRPRANAGELQLSAGSHGMWNVAASRDLAVGDMLGINLAADLFHLDGYAATPEAHQYRFPAKQPNRASNKNFSMTVHAQPDATLRGYVRLGYHVQDQDIGYQYGENLQKSPDLAIHIEKKLPDRTNVEANAWSQYVAFDKLNGSTCYYQGGTTCLTSTSAALTPDKANRDIVQYYAQQGRLRYRESGSSLLYSTRLNAVFYAATAGIDYRRLSAEDTELFYNTPVAPNAPQGRFDNTTTGRGVQTFGGLFGQLKAVPFEALDLSVSARIDHYGIDQRENRRTLASGAQTGGPLPAWSKTALDPSAALRYTLSETVALRAAAYKAFRAPGFNNLTRTFGTGTSTTIANPDLVPENLRGWETGFDYRDGDVTLGLTFFRYDISDMIATFTARAGTAPEQVQRICGGATLPTCGGAARYYTNDQDGRAQGIEAIASWRQSKQLALEAFLTRTESSLTRRGSVVTDPLHEQLVGVPEYVATVGLNWTPSLAWRSRVQGRYTGPMFLDISTNAGPRFSQGGNMVWDLSTEYRWSATMALSLRVTNLSDRRYSENAYTASQAYNQTLSPPRALAAGLRASF